MQTDKEKWVEEVMRSADSVRRVIAPDITDRVLLQLDRGEVYTLPLKRNDGLVIWRIAASIAFILLLNVVSIYSYQSHLQRSYRAQQQQEAAYELGLGKGNNNSDPGAVFFGN